MGADGYEAQQTNGVPNGNHAVKKDSEEPEKLSIHERIKAKSLILSKDSLWLPVVENETELGCLEAFKLKAWSIFEDPERSKIAFIVNIYVISLILLSSVVTVVETIPAFHHPDSTPFWFTLECIFVSNFTLEYLLRWFCSPEPYEFPTNTLNVIDIVSILPFYIELALSDLGVDLRMLRILRLGRALRLVKLARYSEGMQMISVTMAESSDALQLFSFIFLALLILCASMIYYTERGKVSEDVDMPEIGNTLTWYRQSPISEQWEISPYQSIPSSIWWVIVTLTTVGYGDVYPITYFGQVCGGITQLLGVLTLALPLSIIGSNFHEIREALRTADEKAEVDVPLDERCPGDLVDDIGATVEECEELEHILEPVVQALDYLMTLTASAGHALSDSPREDNPLYMVTNGGSAATAAMAPGASPAVASGEPDTGERLVDSLLADLPGLNDDLAAVPDSQGVYAGGGGVEGMGYTGGRPLQEMVEATRQGQMDSMQLSGLQLEVLEELLAKAVGWTHVMREGL